MKVKAFCCYVIALITCLNEIVCGQFLLCRLLIVCSSFAPTSFFSVYLDFSLCNVFIVCLFFFGTLPYLTASVVRLARNVPRHSRQICHAQHGARAVR